jgi:hypothetical protein
VSSSRVLAVLFSSLKLKIDLNQVAETFFRYSSQVAVRGGVAGGEGDAIFIEVSKSMGLYSLDTLIHRIRTHLTRWIPPEEQSHSVLWATGEDAAVALAKARYRKNRKGELPVTALLDFVSPFSALDEKEERRWQKKIFLLERLGVSSIGQFLALPEKSMVNHLGGEMLSVYDAVKDSSEVPWPFFHPQETVKEVLSLEEQNVSADISALAGLEGLSFLIKNLIDRVLLRMRGRNERILKFKLVLELEKNSVSEGHRAYIFEISLPHSASRELLTMIREKINFDLQARPLSGLVENILIEVLETAPRAIAQKDLFHPKREEDNEAFRSLLSRLTDKLGFDRVFMAEPVQCYLPEASWVRTQKDLGDDEGIGSAVSADLRRTKDIARSQPLRPLRIFKTPLRVRSDWLSQVEVLDAPEVLSGQWWDQGFERVYFRVRTGRGEEVWVYRTKGDLFIHGLF